MRLSIHAAAASLAVLLTMSGADAMPVGPMTPASVPTNVEHVQFVFGGRNYCWYDGGWRGPGYYWCGYAWRRGYGWGGGAGWHGWGHGGRGPAVGRPGRPGGPGVRPGFGRPGGGISPAQRGAMGGGRSGGGGGGHRGHH